MENIFNCVSRSGLPSFSLTVKFQNSAILIQLVLRGPSGISYLLHLGLGVVSEEARRLVHLEV